jgi:hypothetical protein
MRPERACPEPQKALETRERALSQPQKALGKRISEVDRGGCQGRLVLSSPLLP